MNTQKDEKKLTAFFIAKKIVVAIAIFLYILTVILYKVTGVYMRPLTARQQEVLELLKRHLETTGMTAYSCRNFS